MSKFNELGKVIAQIEKATNSSFLRFLKMKFTGRFIVHKKDFIKIYNEVVEVCAENSIEPVIFTVKEIDKFVFNEDERIHFKHELYSGYTDEIVKYERERLGKKIEGIMKERNLNQSKLAILTGLKQPNISRILKGKYSVTFDILFKIATALDVKVDFFDFHL